MYCKICYGEKYNHATRYWSRVGQGLRNVASITCSYKWSFHFLGIIRDKKKISDSIEITDVNAVRSNSCDPSYVGLFLLSQTISGEYKRYGDEFLRDIMVQITINPFVNFRTMTELLQRHFPKERM